MCVKERRDLTLDFWRNLVCNGDARMKNFSLQNSVDNQEVYDLTPAYDLLNISLHMQGLENSRMALDLFKDEIEFATPFFEAKKARLNTRNLSEIAPKLLICGKIRKRGRSLLCKSKIVQF